MHEWWDYQSIINPPVSTIYLSLTRSFCAVDLMTEGATLTLRNAKIDMFKGSMRLAVDRWGRIEVTEPASFSVKEDNNLSLIEFEQVNVFG